MERRILEDAFPAMLVRLSHYIPSLRGRAAAASLGALVSDDIDGGEELLMTLDGGGGESGS